MELDSYEPSPILKLPADILLPIVTICANDDQNGHVMSKGAIQWVVSQTCRSWRDIVLCSPSLWQVIRVNGKRNQYPMDPVSMLKTWLSRSQSLPISCHIVLNGWYQLDDDRPVEAAIMDLIIGDSHRWLNIFLKLGERLDLYYRVGTIQRPLPLLRFFQIFAAAPEDSPEQNPHIFETSPFASAPCLTEADIDVSPPLPPIPLPWHQLRLCRYLDTNQFFERAINLQNLRHLTLSTLPPMFSPGFPLQFSLARLRRLEANLLTSQLVADLLDIIVVPSLRELKIDPFFLDGAESLLLSIVNLQERNSCQLERLYIPINVILSASLPELGKALDTVEELHLRLYYYPSVGEVTPGRALIYLRDRSLSPRLKALYLVIYLFNHDTIPDDDPFFDGIADIATARRTRNQFDVQFERLSIDTSLTYSPKTSKWEKTRIPAYVRGIQQVLKLQSEGLVLLESIVDGWLCPVHGGVTHWDAERVDRDAARYLL